jgi:hypothetical protein
MGILYVYNEKMLENYMLQAFFNKICIIINVSPQFKNILIYLKKNNILKNNVLLLLDKIWKVMAFK